MSNQRPNVEFNDVSEYLPSWNCMTKGSTKTNDLVQLEPTPDSWLMGYYIDTEDVTIQNYKYKKHKFLATHVGNNEHLREVEAIDPNGTMIEVLGAGTLNMKLEESVQAGQYVEIKYLGKQAKKNKPTESYHHWFVGVAGTVEPLVVKEGVIIDSAASSGAQMQQEAAQPAAEVDPGVGGVMTEEGSPAAAQAVGAGTVPPQGTAVPGDAPSTPPPAGGKDDLPF